MLLLGHPLTIAIPKKGDVLVLDVLKLFSTWSTFSHTYFFFPKASYLCLGLMTSFRITSFFNLPLSVDFFLDDFLLSLDFLVVLALSDDLLLITYFFTWLFGCSTPE